MEWSEAFGTFARMSLTAGVIIVAVIALRVPLRRAPRKFSYALWGIVLFRLLCPVSLSSDISVFRLAAKLPAAETLQNAAADVAENLSSAVVFGTDCAETDEASADNAETGENPALSASELSGENADATAAETYGEVLDDGAGTAAETVTSESPASGAVSKSENAASVGGSRSVAGILAAVWLAGACAMAGYTVFRFIALKRRTACSMRLRDNIYLADGIRIPFVFGIFCPRIYLPSALSDEEMPYIILHEQCHIRRLDHVAKPLAYLALCLHWFNPLVWLAFYLAEKDMETSCDEAVLRKMGADVRWKYSASLLHLATGRNVLSELTPAFGGGGQKDRIRHVINYKKPGRILQAAAVCLCAVAALSLLTDPKTEETGAVRASEKTEAEGDVGGLLLTSSDTAEDETATEIFPEAEVEPDVKELLCRTVSENASYSWSLGERDEGETTGWYADFYTLKVSTPVRVSEPTNVVTYYGVALCAEYVTYDGVIRAMCTYCMPTVITFEETDDGCQLAEYWEAEETYGDAGKWERIRAKYTGQLGESVCKCRKDYANILQMRFYAHLSEEEDVDVTAEMRETLLCPGALS